MNQSSKTPKVSVCVITYNQEKYIRQCLQSIVDQETDFDFEVIVGEDCSTDGTRAIVQEFMEHYPGLIKGILQSENIGGCKNYISVHAAALGKYVAHLDGDDMMKPGKLSAQVALLNSNPNSSACFHLMDMVDIGSQKIEGYWLRDKYAGPVGINEILLQHPNIGHSSLMFRRTDMVDFLKSREVDFIDMQIYLHLASKGLLLPINEVLGTYRVGVGVSRNLNVLDAAIHAASEAGAYGADANVVKMSIDRLSIGFALQMLLISNYEGYLKYHFLSSKNDFYDDPVRIIFFKILRNKITFKIISKLYTFRAKWK